MQVMRTITAMQAAGHNNPWYGQHRARPRTKREDRAPTVSEWEERTRKPGPPASQQQPAPQPCEAAQQQAQNNFNAINNGFYQKAYKSALKGVLWGGAAGCLITSEIGCAEGGLPGALIGGLGGAAKSMAEDIIYETVDTIQANEPCEGSR